MSGRRRRGGGAVCEATVASVEPSNRARETGPSETGNAAAQEYGIGPGLEAFQGAGCLASRHLQPGDAERRPVVGNGGAAGGV